MDNTVFQVRNLDFAYGSNQVIQGLSVDIKSGKITTLIGANGCGKSTLFNLMTKNLKAKSGKIIIAATVIARFFTAKYAVRMSYDKLTELNRRSFSPLYADLLPKTLDKSTEKA